MAIAEFCNAIVTIYLKSPLSDVVVVLAAAAAAIKQ